MSQCDKYMPRNWQVRMFNLGLWEYVGEPEFFATKKEAMAWVENRRGLIAENGCQARISKVSTQ